MAAHPPEPRLLAVLTALLAGLALMAAPATAQQDHEVTPARADGESRFETAVTIAGATFDDAPVAIIVTGADFPDALAASFAAGSANGPILLVESDAVPPETAAALEELRVETAVLVGGVNAISAAVEEQLESDGYETVRIDGDDRFETAAAVAVTYGSFAVGELEGERTAFLASGEDESFPDALSAGPLAASAQLPLLLTPGDRVDPVVDATLEELEIERVIIVGGRAAVSSAVAEHYAEVYAVERFAGATRTETAAIVADNAIERFDGFSAAGVLLARGDDYPDALAASTHGAVIGAPILLTENPTDLSAPSEDWLVAACPAVDFVRALGGTAAVSEQTLDEAVSAAERCHDGGGGGGDDQAHTEQSYIQAPQQAVTSRPGGEPHEITVSGFEHPESNPAPVNIALFPCEVADPTDETDHTFRDADDDGFADAIGTTSTDSAVISSVHGTATDTTHLDSIQPDQQHQIRYTIHSDAEDCAVHVVFHDANDNDRLDVDDQGRPLEHWNYGSHEWASG